MSAIRLIVVACCQIVRNDSEGGAYTVISMMLPMSRKSDGVPADESPTLHFAGCRSSGLDLEMRRLVYLRQQSAVGVRRMAFRRFAQLLSPSTDGNIFDFRNIAFPAR